MGKKQSIPKGRIIFKEIPLATSDLVRVFMGMSVDELVDDIVYNKNGKYDQLYKDAEERQKVHSICAN